MQVREAEEQRLKRGKDSSRINVIIKENTDRDGVKGPKEPTQQNARPGFVSSACHHGDRCSHQFMLGGIQCCTSGLRRADQNQERGFTERGTGGGRKERENKPVSSATKREKISSRPTPSEQDFSVFNIVAFFW